ncbi:phage tail protein [Aureibacter tunicatorum]|uniref:Phage tail-like protein n=1 Tax=Aureibacter tunicatorum TaxID=866807 RepID=A0AAE4BRB6_9BACT|nr:phage tail protein [Aureibacter tunicatorum]MDR6240039.1 phage tail-like protein [Aureibacter tunicatorum]BDD04511.1 hypothetical protein AUTU_19940 [Aureibacter tunicatorum]
MADAQSDITEKYPVLSYRYKAVIGDKDTLFFSEVSGLKLSFESAEYKEATDQGIKIYQVPAQLSTPEITMKKGMFNGDTALFDWFNSTHSDKFSKQEVVISQLDNENKAIMVWTITNAFPTSFEGPTLDAKSNEVAFESVTLKGLTLTMAKA